MQKVKKSWIKKMSTFYNYAGTFNNEATPPNVTFALSFTVNGSNVITAVSGTISYTTTYTNTSNISILSTNTFHSNDNVLNATTIPCFTVNGLAFSDNTNSISYNISLLNGSGDGVRWSIVLSAPFPFVPPSSETLSAACLYYNTNILTMFEGEKSYKLISDLSLEDIILSEAKEFKIKRILVSENGDLPYKIPKDLFSENIPSSDLYISSGHAIKLPFEKYKDKFILPESLGIRQQTIEELKDSNLFPIKYYHIELETGEGETRRSNTLTANGVVVESYSSDEIVCDM